MLHKSLYLARKKHLVEEMGGANPLVFSYDVATAGFGDLFDMKDASAVDGYDRVMGQSSNKLASLEIIGDKSNISSATLAFMVPRDNAYAFIQHTMFQRLFLVNLVPDWADSLDWAASAIKRSMQTGRASTIIRGHKIIRVTFVKPLGMILLTVEYAPSPTIPVSHMRS